jgi:hydroxymethylglutaryl-CoA reductase (NADPH)
MLLKIPSLVLKQLYTFGSLANTATGIQVALKNRLSDATLTGLAGLEIDGEAVPVSAIAFDLGDGGLLPATSVSPSSPVEFPLKKTVTLRVSGVGPLPVGNHDIAFRFEARPFGKLEFEVHDAIAEPSERAVQIPYDKENDHTQAMAERRQRFLEERKRNSAALI